MGKRKRRPEKEKGRNGREERGSGRREYKCREGEVAVASGVWIGNERRAWPWKTGSPEIKGAQKHEEFPLEIFRLSQGQSSYGFTELLPAQGT